jgi:hypothetical protein
VNLAALWSSPESTVAQIVELGDHPRLTDGDILGRRESMLVFGELVLRRSSFISVSQYGNGFQFFSWVKNSTDFDNLPQSLVATF